MSNQSEEAAISLTKVIIPSIILFIVGFFVGVKTGYTNPNSTLVFLNNLMWGYVFAGIPWGWKLVSRFWIVYKGVFYFLWTPILLLFKLWLSAIVGLVAFPIVIIIRVVSLSVAKKAEKDIQG